MSCGGRDSGPAAVPGRSEDLRVLEWAATTRPQVPRCRSQTSQLQEVRRRAAGVRVLGASGATPSRTRHRPRGPGRLGCLDEGKTLLVLPKVRPFWTIGARRARRVVNGGGRQTPGHLPCRAVAPPERTHAPTHACICTHARTHTHTHTREHRSVSLILSLTHTRTRTHTHVRAHTHSSIQCNRHTHTQPHTHPRHPRICPPAAAAAAGAGAATLPSSPGPPSESAC